MCERGGEGRGGEQRTKCLAELSPSIYLSLSLFLSLSFSLRKSLLSLAVPVIVCALFRPHFMHDGASTGVSPPHKRRKEKISHCFQLLSLPRLSLLSRSRSPSPPSVASRALSLLTNTQQQHPPPPAPPPSSAIVAVSLALALSPRSSLLVLSLRPLLHPDPPQTHPLPLRAPSRQHPRTCRAAAGARLGAKREAAAVAPRCSSSPRAPLSPSAAKRLHRRAAASESTPQRTKRQRDKTQGKKLRFYR